MYCKVQFILSIVLICTLFACNQPSKEKVCDFPFQNPELCMDERIDDLLSRMTIEEKTSQMLHASPAIERMGIPEYNWWNECLHGVARAGRATIFPQPMGLAATFDSTLIYKVASAISDEARAKYHESMRQNAQSQYLGLTFWSPNVNLFRDPRWGRGMETYGEDPYLSGLIGSAFVRGLQGDDPNYLKVAACAKHYVVHSGPEGLRHEFNAIASEQDLRQTYLPAFKRLIESNVESVMCAYNRTNDKACCGSDYLLEDILRAEYGFGGHVLSDCGAIKDFFDGHGVSNNAVEAAALALKSGVSLNCGEVYENLNKALTQGLITEGDVDNRLRLLLQTKFKLGMFDPVGLNPYDHISTDVVNCKKHQDLAYESAIKSIVMLKNDGALPLSDTVKSIFVAGPHVTNAEVLIGNYFGMSANLTTISEGITKNLAPHVKADYRKGAMAYSKNVNPVDWTTGNAHEVDVVIAAFGIDGLYEGEEGDAIASPYVGDRFELSLPESQLIYLRKLRNACKGKLVVVLTGGSPILMDELNELADAVIFAWYPGEQGGNAIGDVIFGKASPSGKLPISFPVSMDQLPAYEDYSMANRTHRYMNVVPAYPFGYGMTYGKFSCSKLKLSQNGRKYTVKTSIENKAKEASDEVVQLYIKPPKTNFATPNNELRKVKRLHLKSGEKAELSFDLTKADFEFFNEQGMPVLINGKYELVIANASPVKGCESLPGYWQQSIEIEL